MFTTHIGPVPHHLVKPHNPYPPYETLRERQLDGYIPDGHIARHCRMIGGLMGEDLDDVYKHVGCNIAKTEECIFCGCPVVTKDTRKVDVKLGRNTRGGWCELSYVKNCVKCMAQWYEIKIPKCDGCGKAATYDEPLREIRFEQCSMDCEDKGYSYRDSRAAVVRVQKDGNVLLDLNAHPAPACTIPPSEAQEQVRAKEKKGVCWFVRRIFGFW